MTALALPIGAFVAGLAVVLAGDGPDYRTPSVEAAPIAAAALCTTALVLVVLATIRWRNHLVLRVAAWTIGATAIVLSLPFVIWVVGIPVLTWGRALMITSELRPWRLLRHGRSASDSIEHAAPNTG